LTVLRLEGFGPSVQARVKLLEAMGLKVLDEGAARDFWQACRNPLPAAKTLWRISVPASRAPDVVAGRGGDWRMDWAGGLIWADSEDAEGVRGLARAAGGHAMLIRAPEAICAEVPALHPQLPGVAALETRVRRAFDPLGVFETGRF
jgi:glycolate oxidase FAD binding subunit